MTAEIASNPILFFHEFMYQKKSTKEIAIKKMSIHVDEIIGFSQCKITYIKRILRENTIEQFACKRYIRLIR